MKTKNPAKRNEYRQRNYAQTQNAPNSGKEWTASEDREVMYSRMTDRELAGKLGRSVQSIQIRRSRIGGAK